MNDAGLVFQWRSKEKLGGKRREDEVKILRRVNWGGGGVKIHLNE